MTYAIDSSLLSPPIGTEGQWADALRPHNPRDADVLAATYFKYVAWYGINPDLALAQMVHETGWATSARYRDEHNMAGLGVTSNTTPPNPFRSLDEGVRAHYEHLACHAFSLSTCPANHQALADRRHFFHTSDVTLSGIQTPPFRWAAGQPGGDPLDYVRSICAIANGVVGNGGTMPDPYDRIHWSADQGPTRNLADVRWFVVHDTEGHFAGDESVLTSPAVPVESAHFILGRQPGECVYSVPLDTTAWTAGNDELGALAVQVEMSKAPDETGYTNYQYGKLAEIFRWCVQEGMTGVPPVYLGLHPKDDNNGPLPDDAGIIGHAGVPNPDVPGAWGGVAGHTDPGPDFDWNRFINSIQGAAPPPPAWNVVDGIPLGPGFWQLYNAVSPDTAARYRIFGKLLKGDHEATLTTADGAKVPVVAAVWERLTLIWDKGATPDEWSVRVPLATEQVS